MIAAGWSPGNGAAAGNRAGTGPSPPRIAPEPQPLPTATRPTPEREIAPGSLFPTAAAKQEPTAAAEPPTVSPADREPPRRGARRLSGRSICRIPRRFRRFRKSAE